MSRLSAAGFGAALLVTALLGCATPERRESPSAPAKPLAVDKKPPSEYAVAKQIRYSYTLRNKTDRVLPKAEFWTYAPVPQTSHQWVEKVSVSQPYRASRDVVGNEILSFEFENLAPYATKVISITVDIKMADVAAPTSDSDMTRFARPERYIESDHAKIKGLAQQLRQLSPIGSVRGAYDWVATNVKSQLYIPEDRGALYAITERTGDCTEFAYLLTALSRAEDVPARAIGGYVFKGNAVVKAVDYHNWMEFFVDGYWQIADAQRQVFMQSESDYVAMRIIAADPASPLGNSHRYSYAGEGLDVSMN